MSPSIGDHVARGLWPIGLPVALLDLATRTVQPVADGRQQAVQRRAEAAGGLPMVWRLREGGRDGCDGRCTGRLRDLLDRTGRESLAKVGAKSADGVAERGDGAAERSRQWS